MSSNLCKLIGNGETEKAISLINRMSTIHINSYSAPLFVRPILLRMFERGLELPLLSACQEGNYEVAKVLLEKGADPNKFLMGSWTPIEAVFARHQENRYEIAKLLIEYGADVNLHGGRNPAFIEESIRFGSENFDEIKVYRNLTLLWDNGADLVDSDGGTALHYAALGNKAEAIRMLLDNYYTNVDYADTETGVTPLMSGALKGSIDAVKILLEYGADMSIKDMDGKTAYDHAIENGHTELAELLKP
jgi:ankyrin repeat protein